MFSVVLVMTDGYVEKDPLMASTLARFQSSGFLPVELIKTLAYVAPVDNEEVLHRCILDAYQTNRI
jgi:hypothetical protein